MNQNAQHTNAFVSALEEELDQHAHHPTKVAATLPQGSTVSLMVSREDTLDGKHIHRVASVTFDGLEESLAHVEVKFYLELTQPGERSPVTIRHPRLATIMELNFDPMALLASTVINWCEHGLVPSEKVGFLLRAPRGRWEGKYSPVSLR